MSIKNTLLSISKDIVGTNCIRNSSLKDTDIKNLYSSFTEVIEYAEEHGVEGNVPSPYNKLFKSSTILNLKDMSKRVKMGEGDVPFYYIFILNIQFYTLFYSSVKALIEANRIYSNKNIDLEVLGWVKSNYEKCKVLLDIIDTPIQDLVDLQIPSKDLTYLSSCIKRLVAINE